MRKLTGAAFVSLDGVMQAPGGPTEDTTGDFDQGGWVFGIGDDVIDPVLGELFTPPYALLLGRRTYDIFAAYWPFVEGEMADMGGALTAADKHVVTHGDQPLAWANSHRLDGIAAIQALKDSDGPDLVLEVAGDTLQQLLLINHRSIQPRTWIELRCPPLIVAKPPKSAPSDAACAIGAAAGMPGSVALAGTEAPGGLNERNPPWITR